MNLVDLLIPDEFLNSVGLYDCDWQSSRVEAIFDRHANRAGFENKDLISNDGSKDLIDEELSYNDPHNADYIFNVTYPEDYRIRNESIRTNTKVQALIKLFGMVNDIDSKNYERYIEVDSPYNVSGVLTRPEISDIFKANNLIPEEHTLGEIKTEIFLHMTYPCLNSVYQFEKVDGPEKDVTCYRLKRSPKAA
ncbi:MAG: hypothetical protein KAI18_01315 [Candidatus Aenigmarchaeota archaeon]|nr:hypothetical protein [Candidatus Aenigmarchaeota archaeon]